MACFNPLQNPAFLKSMYLVYSQKYQGDLRLCVVIVLRFLAIEWKDFVTSMDGRK